MICFDTGTPSEPTRYFGTTTMQRNWLASYPSGVPHDIDPDSHRSVVEIFDRAIARFGRAPAFNSMGSTLCYDDLDRNADALAAFLQHELGVRKGDRIAVMLPNLLQYPVSILGILRAGATVVNVNPLYTPRELLHQLNDAEVSVIVIFSAVTPALAEVAAETGVRHVVIAQLGDLLALEVPKSDPDPRLTNTVAFEYALARGAQMSPLSVTTDPEDIAFLQYTGGTTGVSKGAALTHRNIVANILQTATWLLPKAGEGEEVVITPLPLYHIFALTVNCLVFVHLGGYNVLIADPRDLPGLVKVLSGIRFSVITGVNTLYNGLLHTPGFGDLDFSTLKLTIGGGAAVQKSVAERWEQVTGGLVLEGYGLSETSPVLCVNPATQEQYQPGIGLPVPSTHVSLRNANGEEVAPGEVGELCAKGPQVMAGYWRRPDATRDAMTADGFFRTGDLAKLNKEGRFCIVDRKKDMILVSGFNVYPNEVEDVIASCTGVLEVACIGVPNEKSGEAVKVFIVRNPEAILSETELEAYCRANLAGYKVPKHYAFVSALPKSPVGKILRRELRDL